MGYRPTICSENLARLQGGLGGILFLGSLVQAGGAEAQQVIFDYPFNNNLTGSAGAGVVSTTLSISGLYRGNIANDGYGDMFNAEAKTGSTTAANTTSYFDLSFAAKPGTRFNLSSLSFDVNKGGSGSRGFLIYSSADNFASPLSSYELPAGAPQAPEARVVALSGVNGLDGVDAQTFRFYVYTPGSGLSVNWWDIVLQGFDVNAISPQSYAAMQSVGLNAMRLQRQSLVAQAGRCRESGWVLAGGERSAVRLISGRSGERRGRRPLCLFAIGGNAVSKVNGSDGLSGYDSTIAGGFYGLEARPSEEWTVGVAYGYGTTTLSNLGEWNNRVNSAVNSASVYGVYRSADSAWTLKTLAGYGHFDLDSIRRTVAQDDAGAARGQATANGYTFITQLERSILLTKADAKAPVRFAPRISLAYGAYQQNALKETNGMAMNLSVDSHTSQSLIGAVGAELVAEIPLNSARTQSLKPRLTVDYQVDALANTNGNTSVTATLLSTGESLSARGQSRGVHDLQVSGSLEYVISEQTSLYASATYEVFSNGSQFAYGGGLKISF